MAELELSLMGTASRSKELQDLLARFEAGGRARVKVTYRDWDSAWSDMVRNSIHGVSPAVSEVGTSWVPDLVGMNALHPLPAAVMHKLGDESDYPAQVWKSCFLAGSPQMWAAPWLSGARVVYYRRDLLDRAGLDPAAAFANPAAMLDTVVRLHEAGIAHPWITSTTASLNTMHLILSWVWASGGDFVSKDGRRLLFAEQDAVDGMTTFFRMGRYMGLKSKECSYETAIDLFWRGEAAVTMDGTWIYETLKRRASPQVLENLGVALAPGPTFVGGSNLVIWTNTADKEAAQDLLLFMTEPDSVLTISRLTGLIPSRRDLMNAPEVTGRDHGEIFNRAVQTGRSLPNQMFSGMVEDKLHYTFGSIWVDVLNTPDLDPGEIITNHLAALKERLELAIFG